MFSLQLFMGSWSKVARSLSYFLTPLLPSVKENTKPGSNRCEDRGALCEPDSSELARLS